MTKSNAVSVRGYQLKKVGRRSARLAGSNVCALGSYAPADVTSAHHEAVPTSSEPGAAALAQTELHQNVHQTMLAPHNQDSARDASAVPVAGHRTQDYCDWWREQVSEQNDLSLFNVRLVGDASSPQLFSSMAHIDLAYCRYACCWKDLIGRLQSTLIVLLSDFSAKHKARAPFICSKWGYNRVMEHKAAMGPLILIMPVLTKPEIVEEALAGILSGQISLSLSNVEAVLVLANAIGVSQLPCGHNFKLTAFALV